jgi:hypothetical protein
LIQRGKARCICASGMTARHSTLFTLWSGNSGLEFYTTQRDAAAMDARALFLARIKSDSGLQRLLQDPAYASTAVSIARAAGYVVTRGN